ncbi:hypothetical protein [Candidatus Kuenenia stuttgartiensis]|uniref:hypothetical protein n=1 Tax=Kuenenia stuttgartiensis TaxID=174633 RepID=UPI001469A912
MQYPFVVLKAGTVFMSRPLVSNYLIAICAAVNKFYNASHEGIQSRRMQGLQKQRILLVDAPGKS